MQKFLYFILGIAFVVPSAVFAASGLPAAESKLVKKITHNSAYVYGTVFPGKSEDNAYWFEWGVVGREESENIFKTTNRNISITGGKKEVYASLRGLAPDTQYFFRVMAENQAGVTAGDVVYFTTQKIDDRTQSIVIATTRNAVNIKEESAVVYGYVATHDSIAKAWFDYGSNDKLEFSTRYRSIGKSGGEVSDSLTNLVPGTTYYYRTVAEGDRGIVRGEIRTFKTTGTKPASEAKKAQPAQAINTKTTKATLAGTQTKTATTNKSLFAGMFGGSKDEDTSDSKTSKTKDLSNTGSVVNSVKDVSVTVKTISESKNSQTVKYEITYKYNRKEAGTDAEIRTTLPKTLIYAGDSTNGEMLVMDEKNGLKTYILPIGNIKKGDVGTFSIVCVLSSGSKTAPKITSTLAFNSKTEGLLEVNSLVANVASSNTGMSFPTGAISFIIFLIVVVVIISLILKAKDLYKEALVRTEESKKKTEEITKTIGTNLAKQDSVHYGIGSDSSTPSSNPVPVKPKVINEFENSNNNMAGLPGMEVL